MDRRTASCITAAWLLAVAREVRAQPRGKPWHVGYVANGLPPRDARPPAALRNAIQALGYVEDRDVVYESRWGELDAARTAKMAGELVSRPVDLIVAMGSIAGAATHRLTSTIPIVVVNAGDLVEVGLVSSLARPGANVTGVNDRSATLSAKRLELLTEIVPTAKRIAVLWNADDRAMTLRYREIERAAEALGIRIDAQGVREPDDFDAALAAMDRERPDALMMVTDALTNLNRQRVIDYAARRRIPAVYEFATLVQDGGLMSYGGDIAENHKLAATYVARIFKGAKPGELPIEQPSRYTLAVNLSTARAIGLVIPQSLLLRADQVID